MHQQTAADPRAKRLIRAIASPLVVLGLAYLLWRISDRLLVIGPFDRAAFGWAVVVPIWLSAPIIAGVVWRGMPDGVVHRVAVAVAAILAVASGWLFWKAVAFPGCTYGSNVTPEEMVAPAGFVGLALGGGIALAGVATRAGLRRYALLPALGLGLIAAVAAFVVTFGVAVAAFGGPPCQRPPIG